MILGFLFFCYQTLQYWLLDRLRVIVNDYMIRRQIDKHALEEKRVLYMYVYVVGNIQESSLCYQA